VKTEFHLDYPTILANQARPVHFAIRFVAGQVSQPRPQPAAFCAVVDRSGSMAGVPLAHAKEAAKVAVKNLRPGDRFGLVVFDDEARTVIPLQPAANKQAFYEAIDHITDGGSTNLTGGWMLGRDELRKAEAGTLRRLLLLSDGQLNHGIVDPPLVRQVVVAGLEQDGVRTSCLGFGDAYNEDLMAELARATNGQFYDADSPETLPAIFAAELDGLQKLAVQNLRVRLQPLQFCERYAPLGEYPALKLPDGRMEFAIGDLVSEEERVVCFAVQALALPLIAGKPAFDLQGELLLDVEVLWDELLEQGVVSRTLTQQVRIQATQDPAQVVVNSVVAPWITLQKAGVVAAEVNRRMDQGQVHEALAALAKTIQELEPYGERAAEAIHVLREMQHKIANDEWNVRERKLSRYRSSNYRKMSSKELWSPQSAPAPSFKQPPKDPNAPGSPDNPTK
jgi:Ca-activated chloride channel family protein